MLWVASSFIVSQNAEAFSLSGHGAVRPSTILNRPSSFSLSAAVMEEIGTETQLESMLQSTNNDERESSSLPSTRFDWSFVEKVYLITCPNADPNSERLNKAKDILDKVGLLDQVEVKEFDTDDEDRIRGCYASHISVLKDGLRDIRSSTKNTKGGNDWLSSLLSMFDDESSEPKSSESSTKPKCIMVLEDNLEFSGSISSETLNSVADYLESDKGADMIHLSYIPYVPNLVVSKTDDKNIVSLSTGQSSALGTTAYVITEKAIETLLQEDAKNGYRAPIPDVMAEQFPESRFSAYPTPFLRAPKTKSLINPQLDDLRSILFQPPAVAQFQNILAITGLSTNTLFFMTIGGLLGASGIAGMGVVDAANQMIVNGSYDGNLFLLVVNTLFTTFSLAILAQGVLLAPKPPQDAP